MEVDEVVLAGVDDLQSLGSARNEDRDEEVRVAAVGYHRRNRP